VTNIFNAWFYWNTVSFLIRLLGTWPSGQRRIQFYFNRSAPKLERETHFDWDLVSSHAHLHVASNQDIRRRYNNWFKMGELLRQQGLKSTRGHRLPTGSEQLLLCLLSAHPVYMMSLCKAFLSYILRSEKSDLKTPFKWIKRKSDGNFKRLRVSEIVHVAAVPAHFEKMASRPLQQGWWMIHVWQAVYN